MQICVCSFEIVISSTILLFIDHMTPVHSVFRILKLPLSLRTPSPPPRACTRFCEVYAHTLLRVDTRNLHDLHQKRKHTEKTSTEKRGYDGNILT